MRLRRGFHVRTLPAQRDRDADDDGERAGQDARRERLAAEERADATATTGMSRAESPIAPELIRWSSQ